MGDMLTASVATSADSRRRKFAEHGVVVVPGFLDREQVALLNREIDAHYGPLVRERFGIGAVSRAAIEMDCDVIVWDPLGEEVEPFEVLAADPRLATLTRELIGEFSAPGSLVMWSVGGGKGQAWHQDCPPDDPSQFNLNRLFYLQDTEASPRVSESARLPRRFPPRDHQDRALPQRRIRLSGRGRRSTVSRQRGTRLSP